VAIIDHMIRGLRTTCIAVWMARRGASELALLVKRRNHKGDIGAPRES
jgi:hypothetical protein